MSIKRRRTRRPNSTPRRRALGGVNPRELPPGTVYPCDDSRIGTRASGDHFAGTVVACAVPPAGKRGRFFVVGGIESGADLSREEKRRERTREILRARWEGPDLDARPARGGRAKAPPPSSLAALPVPEAREMVLHRGDGAIARPGPTDRARESVLSGEVIDLDARPQSRVMRDLRAAAERFMGREELVEEDLGAFRRAEDALFERTGNVSFARLIVPPASPDASQRRRDAVDARRKSRVAQGIKLARNAKTLDAKIRASTQSKLADRVALALIALADAAPVGSFPGESPGVAPAPLTVVRPRRSLPVIQPRTRRRLPVIQPPPKRRAPEAAGPAWSPSPRFDASTPRTAEEKIDALAEAVRLALAPGARLAVKRKPYFTEFTVEGGDYAVGVDIRHTSAPQTVRGGGLRDLVGAAWTRGPRPSLLAVLTDDATMMGLSGTVSYRNSRRTDSRLEYLASALLGRSAPRLVAALAARPDLDAILRAPIGAFTQKVKKAPPRRAVALRSIADVLGAEGGPWKPAPMSPLYARTRATANADSAWRDVTEVAKLVRADIAKAIAARQLPKGLTASVRSDKYSMGQSLKVEVIPPPWMTVRVRPPESDLKAQAYGIRAVLSPEAEMIRERVQWIVNRYNRNDSDLSTDYHDVNFYDDVQIGGEREAQEEEILKAEHRGEVPVDIALTRSVRRALEIDERREEAVSVFAVVPGRVWRVAVWAKGAPMGRDAARERLRSAMTLDASDPEEALASARELALGAGLVKE